MLRSFRTVFFFFLNVLVIFSTHAQQRPEVYKILGITVEGARSADPTAVIANTGLKVGDEITIPGEQTRQAIERLYNLKLFGDVQIFIENKVQNGVYLLLRLKENPRLDRVEIVGNDELSEDDINKKINLIRGQIVTEQDLRTVERVLRKQYESDGYYNARVKPELVNIQDTTGRQRVVLKITVDEGSKVKVDKIRFIGNKHFEDGDLRSEMKDTDERVWWKFWSSNKFDPKKYKDDKDRILAFYHKNGFRDAEILSDSLSFEKTKEYLAIDLFVFEGPQYRIRNIVWEGNNVYPTEALNERLGFKQGDIYNKEKLDQNLRRNESESDISSLYYDVGYLMFQVDPVEVKVAPDSLDLVIKVRERNQFRVGQVAIQGNSKTYEKVIRRELYTRPGDFFSRQAIIRSVRQLAQLNYFNPEKIKPDTKIADDKTVDLEYDVEEKSSDTFNMSIGYSGAFGFNGGLGLTFNNFSLAEPLRGGAGQVLNFDWQFGVSNFYRTFTIGFTEPWMFDTPTLLGVNFSDTRTAYFYNVHSTGISVRVGRRLKWPDYLFRGDWTVRYQQSAYSGVDAFFNAIPSDSTISTSQFGITQVISRNSTDSPLFPSRGSNFSLSTEVSFGPASPTVARFHKHVFNAEWYVPVLGSSRIALMTSSTFGMVFGFDKASFVPIYDYFFMGGTGLGQFAVTPLRGYEERSIGPKSSRGTVIGGKTMIKHMAELRFSIALNPVPIYALFFAEAGNTWADHTVQDPLDLKRSAGIGVRLLVNPIGLLGFDYGYGFDDVTGPAGRPDGIPEGWKFHFQFGRSF